MTEDEQLEALSGVVLAQTALIGAVISFMREKGLASQDEINAMFDVALYGAEDDPPVSALAASTARKLLETVGHQFRGPRKADR